MQNSRILYGLAAAGVLIAVAILAWLNQAPPQISLATLEAKYATPDSRFADLDGVRTHYMDQGSGPVVVLLHASFMNLRSWDAVAETLSQNYRVIRLDFLTSGLTGYEPDDRYSFDRNLELLDALLQQLGVGQFDLVGTSSGGIVAFNFAARYPDRVRRLVLINSAGMPRNAKTDPNRVRGSWFSRWQAKRFPSREQMRETLKMNFIEPHEPPDWLIDMNHDMRLREGLQREGALLMAQFRTGDPQQVLSGVRAPTLVAWGLDNATVFHLEADVFAHWLTGAPSVVKKYPGFGHYMYIEDPDMIAADILAFLQGQFDDQLLWHQTTAPGSAAEQRSTP